LDNHNLNVIIFNLQEKMETYKLLFVLLCVSLFALLWPNTLVGLNLFSPSTEVIASPARPFPVALSNAAALQHTAQAAGRVWAKAGKSTVSVAVCGAKVDSLVPPYEDVDLWGCAGETNCGSGLPELRFQWFSSGTAIKSGEKYHAIIHQGVSGTPLEAAQLLVEAWDQLADGGIMIFDNLGRAYEPAPAAAFPFVANNKRWTPAGHGFISVVAPGWPAPKAVMDVLIEHMHSFPYDVPPDKVGARVASMTRSIDCWVNLCIIRKTTSNDLGLPGNEAAAVEASASWSSFNSVVMSDKTTTHSYQHLYDRYLPRFLEHGLRTGQRVRLFEIGLGCTMSYGPGKSFILWDEFFSHLSNIEMTFLEYDAACLANWMQRPEIASRPNVVFSYAGDQRDEALLNRIGAERGPFDVIVDDGGHSMAMQIRSLRTLIHHIVPGGIYVLEDICCTLLSGYAADGPPYTLGYQLDIMDLVIGEAQLRKGISFSKPLDGVKEQASGFTTDQVALADLISHVDSYKEIAAFVRKGRLEDK
jgi:hypothetical protein